MRAQFSNESKRMVFDFKFAIDADPRSHIGTQNVDRCSHSGSATILPTHEYRFAHRPIRPTHVDLSIGIAPFDRVVETTETFLVWPSDLFMWQSLSIFFFWFLGFRS